MLRIAVISVHGCPHLPLGRRDTGGMNVYVRELSRELGRRGHQVDVFTRWHEGVVSPVETLGPGARVIHLPAGPADLDKESIHHYLPEFLAHLKRFCREQGLSYDLIHSHYWLSGLVGMELEREWGRPHLAMFHTLGEVKNRARRGEVEPPHRIAAERAIMGQADLIVAATPHEAEEMTNLYGASPQRIVVIPCGVDLELFRPYDQVQARQALGLNGHKVLLFVGRLEPLKGVELLLRTVAQLEERDELEVLVVGGGPQSEEMAARWQEMAASLGLREQVRFLGAVPQERLPLFYSAADIEVVPSYHESFGMVAVEALACGTPVVAFRVGGLKYTVRDGENGFLVSWRCPEAMAERLDLLLGSELLRHSLGQAARDSVLDLGWPLIADKIEDVYCRLLEPGMVELKGGK